MQILLREEEGLFDNHLLSVHSPGRSSNSMKQWEDKINGCYCTTIVIVIHARFGTLPGALDEKVSVRLSYDQRHTQENVAPIYVYIFFFSLLGRIPEESDSVVQVVEKNMIFR